MTPERTKELLDNFVKRVTTKNTYEQIKTLVQIGFTTEELVNELHYAPCDMPFEHRAKGKPITLIKTPDVVITPSKSDSNKRYELMRIIDNEYSIDQLQQLINADKAGKCMILPCKPGSPVWCICDDCEFPSDCHTRQKCNNCEYRNIHIEE